MTRTAEPQTSEYLARLIESTPLREAASGKVVTALDLPPGSLGLDVGCGNGALALLLAEAVGSAGHVTGIDISGEFIEHGRRLVAKAGMAGRVTLQSGDMNRLPFEDNAFDWALSMDCVDYHHGDPMTALKEMKRVVRPGGVLAICAWSSEKLLPGYPELEARLQATSAGIAPFISGQPPETHYLRTLGRFQALSLEVPSASTIAGEAHAPLSDELRAALVGLFEMRWPGIEVDISKGDLAELHRLTSPESPEFILDEPDYYGFFTYSLFTGKVPG